jgi:hypothetical protein
MGKCIDCNIEAILRPARIARIIFSVVSFSPVAQSALLFFCLHSFILHPAFLSRHAFIVSRFYQAASDAPVAFASLSSPAIVRPFLILLL